MDSMRGFSLIELLMVITITGVLALVTVPLYSQYVTQARRLLAENSLSRLAVAMERYRIEHNTYEGADLGSLHIPTTIAKGRYQLAIKQATAATYVLTATPRGSQAERDACGMLTMNANGEKESASNNKAQRCWSV